MPGIQKISLLVIFGGFRTFFNFFIIFEKKVPEGKKSADLAFEIQLDDVSMLF